jgi:hypothetical protein
VELNLDDEEYLNIDLSASSDFEDFDLSYHMALDQVPNGADATLDPSGATGTFTPDPEIEGTYTVNAWVNDSLVDSAIETITIVAKFFPPLPPSNGKIVRHENRVGFATEYINELTWESNPQNKTLVKTFRIYRKTKGSDDSTYVMVIEVTGETFSHTERGLKKSDLYTYKITSVSYRDKESEEGLVISN